jgi:hypothetical protein
MLLAGEALDKLANRYTDTLSPTSLRKRISTLVAEALSPERKVRRMAHTTIQQSPNYVKEAFLATMMTLTAHTNERVRGEAYYCLGYIPVDDSTYMCTEDFLRDGLSDDSVFVQACCANVLKNFWPLQEATVTKLNELLTYNVLHIDSNEMMSKFVYYASMALNYGRPSTPGGKNAS